MFADDLSILDMKLQLEEVQAKVQKGVNAADKTKGSYFSTNVTDRSSH